MEKDVESPLNLSDEAFANTNWDEVLSEEPAEGEQDEDTAEADEDIQDEETQDKEVDTSHDDSDDDDDDEDSDWEYEEESDEDDSEDQKDSDSDGEKDEPEDTDEAGEEDSEDEEEKEEEEASEPDYKGEYNKLLAPFKANGKQMKVENIEDARTLMQMGANYNKKMLGLKPSLKVVKMLENQGLLDEEKLNFLIDVHNGNPDAIKKLVQESKLDVMELDTDKEVEYQPRTYTVNDKEVELGGILKDLSETESGSTTLDIISNRLDEESQKMITASPDIIPVLNEQVASGMYDQIMEVVEREQALGRLKGMTDLQAYKAVGDALSAAGKFNKTTTNDEPMKEKPKSRLSKKATRKKVADPKLKDRKRAASSTKSSSGKGKDAEFSPLNMSDEEFEKTFSEAFA